jgi:hypothetical protein
MGLGWLQVLTHGLQRLQMASRASDGFNGVRWLKGIQTASKASGSLNGVQMASRVSGNLKGSDGLKSYTYKYQTCSRFETAMPSSFWDRFQV